VSWDRTILTLGVALHAILFALMLAGVEPFHTFFYLLSWWTFIPVIGAINRLKTGDSLVLGDGPRFFWMASCSVVVWLFFESWNFHLQNWLYYGIIEITWLRWISYTVAFATVIPAVLETDLLLGSFGLVKRLTGPALKVTPRFLYACATAGFIMMFLVVLLPDYCFPLLWVGIVFILDPLLYHYDREASFLGQARRGDYQRLARMMLAGLVCGVLWEFWNFWSAAKWVYSIPLLNFWRVFEMPVFGFLGFMPFALECYLFWQLFNIMRNAWTGRGWQTPVTVLALAVIYSLLVFAGIDRITVIWPGT
jgi:hypothetical protein